MKIFHATHIGTRYVGFPDMAQAFVVNARDEQEARRLASEQAGDETAEFWLAPSRTRFDVIGTTARGQNAAVVVRDFQCG